MKILWVEDELNLRKEGVRYLKQEGYDVIEASNAEEALKHLYNESVDIVLLDWLLPDVPGIDVCRTIQNEYKIPVIMITAKTDEFDKVVALEIGADDYISKPFGIREVVARIRAVMRRTNNEKITTQQIENEMIIRGNLKIDLQCHTVYKNSKLLTLTPTEFTLLATLARRPGQVFSRMQLMDEALGEAYLGFERTVDSHIKNLRKKLEDSADEPRYIITVFGIGYKFGVHNNE
ncbi:response regulator transcription factor [Paenibacillus alkalitolerans]|uniref:response regulator transcription factor n=1 Tax=Paenibacillus alkalitolerans TaxID=2799335 RepID=UPI001F36BDF8|nr:response regulator transcription factor [Paenibacillus alkalitolerans]